MKQSFAEINKQQKNVDEISTSKIVSTILNLSQKLDQTSSLIDNSVNIKDAANLKKRLNNLIFSISQKVVVTFLKIKWKKIA